mmetsp:Transcript_3567/g.12790  ORF Transcript_3567/g.12790 Transcript_3567/m.12790 type:complete len:535 (+) Transcript_3567:264-1868(+)
MASPDAAEGVPGLPWRFSQVFGECMPGEEVQDADIISAVEFDRTGQQLATGDRGGRVVLFEMAGDKGSRGAMDEYRYLTEFQSHEPEFDYLKSLEIEEKVNKIRWCEQGGGASRFLLSTNDKTIKLWKVFEKRVKRVSNFNVGEGSSSRARVASGSASPAASNGAGAGAAGGAAAAAGLAGRRGGASAGMRLGGAGGEAGASVRGGEALAGGSGAGGGGGGGHHQKVLSLRLPSVTTSEVIITSRCRRLFANAHAYHINSISINSDCETFISADDLRVNLWNLEVSNQSFNIVDIKPSNMEDLTEVITAAEFHPTQCNVFAYSSSKGSIRLADMRDAALCDRHSKFFAEQEVPGNRSFFSEIIASIGDVKFGAGGRYILARDYLTLKLWDVNMESAPVATFRVHDHLRPKLCDLYENDYIFDKFECCLSQRGDYIASGSYSNMFACFGVNNGSANFLDASKNPHRHRASRTVLTRGRRDSQKRATEQVTLPANDFNTKLLHLAWHPERNTIAAAASNSLYIFSAENAMGAGMPA